MRYGEYRSRVRVRESGSGSALPERRDGALCRPPWPGIFCQCCFPFPFRMSSVKDPSLASQGRLQLELAERRMGALQEVRKRFTAEQPFAGMTIGMALHVTKETGILVRTLRDGGATVAIAGCNPLSTQDDVAAALAEEKDVSVWAYKGETRED